MLYLEGGLDLLCDLIILLVHRSVAARALRLTEEALLSRRFLSAFVGLQLPEFAAGSVIIDADLWEIGFRV